MIKILILNFIFVTFSVGAAVNTAPPHTCSGIPTQQTGLRKIELNIKRGAGFRPTVYYTMTPIFMDYAMPNNPYRLQISKTISREKYSRYSGRITEIYLPGDGHATWEMELDFVGPKWEGILTVSFYSTHGGSFRGNFIVSCL